jgi:DNA-binding MarR family transcriptional regulator
MVSHTNADPDARSVLDSIRRIVQELRLYDRRAEQRVGLSGAQLFVLQKMRAGGAACINELARRTHTHQSSVSVVAQKLVDRKLLRRSRSKADGRVVELELTAKGRKLLRGAPAAAQERLVASLQRLPAVRRRQLKVLLEELVRSSGMTSGPPALFFEDGARKRKGRSKS